MAQTKSLDGLSSSTKPPAADLASDPEIAAAAQALLQQRLRPSQLAAAARHAGAWLWYGYLGAGKMTLLTSQWKSGKTTLVSVLAERMTTGGELAGLAVAAGRAAVFTEEGSNDWHERSRKLHLHDHVSLFCRPFRAKPTATEWQGLVAAMLYLQRQEGLELVVVDPLAVFLPGRNENTAGVMMECLLPLRDLTDAGLAVLLLHHPRKGESPVGQASRGSGALPGHVDILIEMGWHGGPGDGGRRRWLRALSRYEETRRLFLVELTQDGTDYQARDAADDEPAAECRQVVCLVLEDAEKNLTQREILQQWPEDFPKPDLGSLSRALRRGVEQELIRRGGSGRKNEPYLYWLPGKEEDFFPGLNAPADVLQRWQQRHYARLNKLWRVAVDGGDKVPAAASGANADAGSTSPRDDQSPLPASEPAMATPEAAATAPSVPAAASDPSAAGPAEAEVPPSQPAAEAVPPQPAPAPERILLYPPPSLPLDFTIMPTPDPELSDAEKKRRSRRWPYG